MAKRRSAADLSAEMEVLRSQILGLSETEGSDDEIEAAVKRSSELVDELNELAKLRDEAIDYEKKVEAVRALALNPGNRDGADRDGKYLGDKGPEVKRSVDPFDTDPRQLTKTEVISRAKTFIDAERYVPVSDANKAHLERLVNRSQDEDDESEYQFDGSYLARRILLTENKFYRSAFRKYLRLGHLAQYNHDEQRAIAAFQDHELRRAASENTPAAGGFGVPVKVAA